MREITTKGIICLEDGLGYTYHIANIEYFEREDGYFCYTFIPHYSVIDLLPVNLFQGIPGLDMSQRKERYVRENIVPVFISERTPGENRENLWELLEECDMEYLNRLEWLIRTNTRYSGDLLYVVSANDRVRDIEVDDVSILDSRSAGIIRKMLEVICAGGKVETTDFTISDQNRKEYYSLLMSLYTREKKYMNQRRTQGIRKSVINGKYKGRTRIQIDDTKLNEVFSNYEKKKITGEEAARQLDISLSTFNRRYRKYREEMCQ